MMHSRKEEGGRENGLASGSELPRSYLLVILEVRCGDASVSVRCPRGFRGNGAGAELSVFRPRRSCMVVPPTGVSGSRDQAVDGLRGGKAIGEEASGSSHHGEC